MFSLPVFIFKADKNCNDLKSIGFYVNLIITSVSIKS
jgi:hypothetical protein